MPEGAKPLLQSQGSQTRFDMAKNMENMKRKRVLIVGAGAAGKWRVYTEDRLPY
jgi:tRNA A37 threonylcarbamoyladenosine dehydratase